VGKGDNTDNHVGDRVTGKASMLAWPEEDKSRIASQHSDATLGQSRRTKGAEGSKKGTLAHDPFRPSDPSSGVVQECFMYGYLQSLRVLEKQCGIE
jgi:hypothetical protein